MIDTVLVYFLGAMLWATAGYLGYRDDRWNYLIYLFLFMVPAGFLVGLGVIEFAFPFLPIHYKLIFTAAASLGSMVLILAGLYFTRRR